MSKLVWSDVDWFFYSYVMHLVSLTLPFIPVLLFAHVMHRMHRRSDGSNAAPASFLTYLECEEYNSGVTFGIGALQ